MNPADINDINLNFSEQSLTLLNFCIAFIMFGIALTMQTGTITSLKNKRKEILAGVSAQFILLPAFTFLFIYSFNLPHGLALGMLLVAACPGGNVSNFFCALSKGNIALSVTLTGIATIAAVLMTPANFTFWSSLLPNHSLAQTFSLSFIQMIKTTFIILALPLFLGLFIQRKWKIAADLMAKPIRIISFVVLVGFILMALLNNLDHFRTYWKAVVGIVFIHNLIALSTGYGLSKILRINKADTISITIETGIQNSGLALVIIFNFFDGHGGMALIAAWWGVWHLISGTILALILSKGKIFSPS